MVVGPTLVMASNTRVAPPSSSHPPVVGEGDAQRLEAVSSGHNDPAGDAKPSSINPLLLASVCCGSSGALQFLFDREDAQEPPMVVPTQVFVDLLVGYTPGSSTGERRLSVPQASDDVEHGVHQPVLPVADFHETGVVDQPASPAAGSHDKIEDGAAQPALAATAPHDVEDGVDQPAFPGAACGEIEDGAAQPTLPATVYGDIQDGIDQPALIEDVIVQHDFRATWLLKGVTAEGDTALHVVASHGDSTQFQKCARIINERDQGLLFAVNRKGDTALHCAARAGNSQVLACLIELAESCNRLHELLRKENVIQETALHDAVRIGRKDIVESLMEADWELANYPEEGTSPLYLAILLEKNLIACTLYDISDGNLSYDGPHGQNALHAAVLRDSAITKELLKWNNSLTAQVDRDGSTPLHFASSIQPRRVSSYEPWQNFTSARGLWCSNIFMKAFKANMAALYQADNKGFFPIHVAASVGAKGTIRNIVANCPSSAGLRNAEGRTFLHLAVEHKKMNIVAFVCKTPALAWILNMQDNVGNTALHLAVKAGMILMFCPLYGNKAVHLSLPNNNGQTPLDISRSLVRRGMYYTQNTDKKIHRALILAGAKHSSLRWDQIYVKYSRPFKTEDTIKEAEKMKDSSQILGIGSVLIATVAFGSTFAVPGGFTNRGTPTLAGRFTFDAFMMANALAFVCSAIATIGLMFSGSPMVDLCIRQMSYNTAVMAMFSSVTCLSAAFALGAYMVLAPVAHATAIAICALTPLVVLSGNIEALVKWCILARPLCARMGPDRALPMLADQLFTRMLGVLWPFVIIFWWAAIAQKIQNH